MCDKRNFYLVIKSLNLSFPISVEDFEMLKERFLSDFVCSLTPSLILHLFSSEFVVLEEIVVNLYAENY